MRILSFTWLGLAIMGIHNSLASSDPSPKNQQAPPYIYVGGAVQSPGCYGWTNGMTVLDGIRAAGGIASQTQPKIAIYHFEKFLPAANGSLPVYGKAEIYNPGVIAATNQPPKLLRGDQVVVGSNKKIF